MKKTGCCILLFLFWGIGYAQQRSVVSKVFEFCPAPGQFVDYTQYLQPGESVEDLTYEKVLERVSQILVNNTSGYLFSLGAYGGYITVGLEKPLCNRPGEKDFRVLGNAYYKPGYDPSSGQTVIGSAEPGIIQVSQDINGNGLPDDPWYEIKGSRHEDSLSIENYSITYYKPQDTNFDILWKDNQGKQGYVYDLKSQTISRLYPWWTKKDSLTFHGFCLPSNVERNELVETGEDWLWYTYEWGYADNHANSHENSKIDIDWAVDESGEPAQLDSVHFVRVYTGINATSGWLGEVSTEFVGVEDLHRVENESRKLQENQWRIYPNPVTTHLHLVVLGKELQSCMEGENLEIYSMGGQLLFRKKLESASHITCPVDFLSSGMYILKIGKWRDRFLIRGR